MQSMNYIMPWLTVRKGSTGNNFRYPASYASYHFLSEEKEKEVEKHKYPDYEIYRGKHQAMTAKVHSLLEDYKLEKVYLPHEVSDFLSDWLNKHMDGNGSIIQQLYEQSGRILKKDIELQV